MAEKNLRDQFIERFRHIQLGDYNQRYGYRPSDQYPLFLHRSQREVSFLLRQAMSTQFDRDEFQGVLYLVRPVFGAVDGGAMMVRLDERTQAIQLVVDPRYLEAMLDAIDDLHLSRSAADREIRWLIRHEIWHVLLGHNYIPIQHQKHPLAQLAVEFSVNDGALRIQENVPVYPYVSLVRMGWMDRAQELAKELLLPDDWLMDFRQVLRVLERLIDIDHYEVSWSTVDDGSDRSRQVILIRNMRTGKEIQVDEFSLVRVKQSDSDTVDQVLRQLLPHLSDRFQYDAMARRYRYSSHGFAGADRILRPRAIIIPWNKIRSLFGLERRPGFNRRTFHLYPPDDQPLLHRKLVRSQEIFAYIDSSGSISDDQLSILYGTAKQSPYRVRLFFFSTKVADSPHTGGTDYRCIVDHLQQHVSAGNPFPRAVLVFTDGYAEPVSVPNPDRWYWVVIGDDTVPRQCGGHILKCVNHTA